MTKTKCAECDNKVHPTGVNEDGDYCVLCSKCCDEGLERLNKRTKQQLQKRLEEK